MRALKYLFLFAAVISFALMQGDDKAPHHPRVRYHFEVRKDLSTYFTNSDEIIEVIRQALVRKDERIIISYSSSKDSMADFSKIVRELFSFALEETDKPYEGDYLSCAVGGYDLHFTRNGDSVYDYDIIITPDYYTDSEQEQMVDKEVKRLIKSFAFDEDTTDYEKAKAVYDYIYQNVSYDIIHKKNDNYHLKATAFGALIFKAASCQGYAAAMYRLLREVGVNCRVITGYAVNEHTGEKEYHAWNIICIDGRWYNADITFDVQNGGHELFLKSDKDFKGHFPDEKFMTDSFTSSHKTAEQSYVLP